MFPPFRLSAFHAAGAKLHGNHSRQRLALLLFAEGSIHRDPGETQMYYHLLTIRAKDKLYVCHTSDSLINRIVTFYQGYDDPNQLMEAFNEAVRRPDGTDLQSDTYGNIRKNNERR